MTRAHPRFIAVGRIVEDTRDDRADVCSVSSVSLGQGRLGRTYAEECELARQIADALNRCYPNANSGPKK